MKLLIAGSLHLLDALLIEADELGHTVVERLHAVAEFLVEHLADDVDISSVGDIANGSHHLQLRCSLVDREDTCITIETLALIFHNESRTTMDRDSIIGILIGILGVHTLCQGSEGVGQTAVLLHFLALVGCERAVA